MMALQGYDLADLGRIWCARIRGWRAWFGKGSSGYLLGPYRSSEEAEFSSREDKKAVEAGVFEPREAERHTRTEFQEVDFPDNAFCFEDFDGDAMWCVWALAMHSGSHLYFVGTPEWPLPEIYYDRRRCRLAAIDAKRKYDSKRGPNVQNS